MMLAKRAPSRVSAHLKEFDNLERRHFTQFHLANPRRSSFSAIVVSGLQPGTWFAGPASEAKIRMA
jgi:hypothetical protein